MNRCPEVLLAAGLVLGGCSATTVAENAAQPAVQEQPAQSAPDVTPSVPIASEEVTSSSNATATVPEQTTMPKATPKPLARIALNSCDTTAQYDGGLAHNASSYTLIVDANKLFWGADYEQGDSVPSICKRISVTPKELADGLIVKLQKGEANSVTTYDETTSSSNQAYPQQYTQKHKPVLIQTKLSGGSFILQTPEDVSFSINCKMSAMKDDRACKDGALSASEVLRGLTEPTSTVRQVASSRIKSLIYSLHLPETAYVSGDTVATVNTKGLVEN